MPLLRQLFEQISSLCGSAGISKIPSQPGCGNFSKQDDQKVLKSSGGTGISL
jgi:hypothetical protein